LLSDIPPRIFSAELAGVTEAMAKLTEKAAIDPVVKVTVGLSDSGLVTIHEALAYGEIKDESIAGKIKGFFGAGTSSSSSSTTDDAENETITESATTDAAESTPAAAKVIPTSIPLEVTLKYLSIVPYTSTEIAASRMKLQAVDNAEMLRHKKEEARNMLEGYLYRMRDLLDGGETSPFMLFSKPEERQKLEEKMWDGFRWINDEGEDADIKELWSRRDEME
jgi:hypoxia up-regulated 1